MADNHKASVTNSKNNEGNETCFLEQQLEKDTKMPRTGLSILRKKTNILSPKYLNTLIYQ